MAAVRYNDYHGSAPRISLVLTPLDDTNLALAAQVARETLCLTKQIGVTDVVYYNMDEMPSTATALRAVREV